MHKDRFVAFMPFLLAVLLAGCDAIFGDGYEVRIVMDDTRYVVDTSTEFAMTVENRSDNVVYYLCGGEVFIERFEDGDLADMTGALPNCDCLCPSPIEPGKTETWRFKLEQFTYDWAGGGGSSDKTTFRFRLKLYEDTKFAHELDTDDQRSSEFQFVVPG